MKCVRALVFVLVFLAPAVTQAVPILPGAPDSVPLLYACAAIGDIGADDCVDLSDAIRVVEGEGKVTYDINTSVDFPNLAEITLRATLNPDPFISFGATTTNGVPGPVTYAFLFGTPVVPGFYSVATSTGGLSVTNGSSGTSTVATSGIYPTYLSGYGTVGFVPTNLGVDIGTLPCVAGPGVPFTETTVCDQGDGLSTFPQTFFDNLEALVTYTQDDIGSVASWSGAITLDTGRVVPEPTLLGLLGLAAVAFGVRRRRT